MVRVLALLWFCVSLALSGTMAPGAAWAAFDPPGLATDADTYASALRLKAPPQVSQAQRDKVVKEARDALARKDWPKAVASFESAVVLGVDTTSTWMALSEAWLSLPKPNRERALQSAFMAYQVGANPDEQVTALWRLMTLLDGTFDQPDNALQAAREIKTLAAPKDSGVVLDTRAPGLDARIQALRQKVGIAVKSVRVDSDQPVPRACVRFTDQLGVQKGLRFADFVAIEPAVPRAPVDARGDTLCIGGLAHGSAYTITLRQGLPGQDGVALKADDAQRIRVADRRPLVAFRGNAFILPRAGSEGIPVTTVNLPSVAVQVLRINDRSLVANMRTSDAMDALTHYRRDEIAATEGELVWKGRMDIGRDNERNREVTTALPFRDVVPNPKPGLYVVTAEPVDVPSGEIPWQKATQWVLVTDIGLTTFQGADGLTVFARSFASAKPMPGVEVALVARNNSELARATTDELGRARFPVGLTRGQGGNAPMAVMAYAGTDYAMLDLALAAFDLSDRGVGGRAAPGPMDAYLYTDRGVYRQGETVNVTVLLRDDKTLAVDGFPLTVKVLRPSGTEYFSGPVAAGPAGSFVLPVSLTRTAPLGGWTVQAFTDPKGQPVGHATFQVDDFVPERLAVDLTAPAPFIEAGKPFDLLVKGRFLYGPPAAGLSGTAEVSVDADPAPYPQHKGFRFGLVTESVTAKRQDLEFPVSDGQGLSHVNVALPALPDVTRPLRAEIHVTMTEPGGRPARARLSVPVRTKGYAIGLRPRFEGPRLGEGQEASFDVIAVAPDGAPVARSGLAWALVEEHTTFQWYMQNGRYTYRAVTRDIPRAAGALDVAADRPAALAVGAQPFGRYRLEVFDKASGVASSLRFLSGWEMAADSADTPDKLELVADKPAYRPGETAKLRLTPPFAGEVLLTVATDRLFDARTLTVPAGGTEVEVPVDAAWGPGAYVTATLYRPPVKGKDRQPVRAIGVAWLGIDPAVRRLDVALSAPAVARPRGKTEVAIKVTPAAGAADEAYVTLAAVDEGILRLTDFQSPDPGRHFFGKRVLGLDIRDDYGRLIDALDGPFGAMRQGGDSSGAALPVVPFTVVSLFQGPLKVAADGTVRAALDIPDFNGELRLMAVAFSKGRVGSASGRLTVRDPLVADAIMPRFLAPGDDSRVTVSLHNVDAAAGTYQVAVTGGDAVAVENGSFPIDLAAGERRTLTLPFKGLTAGIGRVTLAVKGPDGAAVQHSYGITVRPARPVETQFLTRQLAPGERARLSAADLAAYVPGTAAVSARFSAGAPFDVAGTLLALDRYPFGCLEQTISRALPLLVVRDVELALGADHKPDETLDGRIGTAISRTLDKQRYDGAFGLWSARDEEEPWMTGYAMEFLARAKAKGYAVPDKPFADGLTWLRHHAIDGGREPAQLASRAYALHVLALSGVLTAGPARYFHDAFLDQLPTPLAKGQVGAALARLGDRERAESAFAAALSHLARDPWHEDYGSTVRDAAALVTLLGEAGMTGNRLPVLLDRLPASETASKLTNTQEKAWIVLAADTLARGGAPLDLTVTGGAKPKGDPFNLLPSGAQLAQGVEVANAGKAAVWQAVSLSGIPLQPQPAAREGLRIKRNFLTRDGQPLNLDQIKQNDVFVIVLEGEANTKLFHQAVVTHALPAGWEIENPHLGAAGDIAWLTDLTPTRTTEARDDRYVAAFDLTEESPKFKLAYLVRAVTPGSYELPGAVVEDMYKPRFFARQATGRITVLPAQ